LQTAYEVGKQLLALAQTVQDPQSRLVANQALGTTAYFLGEFAEARANLEAGIALCATGRPRSQAIVYAQDPGVICLSTLARTLWTLGYPDDALDRPRLCSAFPGAPRLRFTVAFAVSYTAVVYESRRDWRATQEYAEALMALSTEQGFAQRLAQGKILLGWALVEQGRNAEGVAL